MADTSAGYDAHSERARVSRSGSDTRARSQVVMVRLTPDEKARFAALAERNRMSLPEMFRMAATAAEMQEAMHG